MMPSGMGEWLAEGGGQILSGFCVITTGVLSRGVCHGCEQIFDVANAEFWNKNLHQGQIPASFLSKPFMPLH